MLKLRKNDDEILNIWANGRDLRLGRRAWLVYEGSKGVGAKELARAVAMPEQRVLEIMDRYADSGLLGLIERPRSGRAQKISSDAVMNLISELPGEMNKDISAAQLIKKLRHEVGNTISKDVVWRQARISGVRLERSSKKRILLSEISGLQSSIIGLVITPEIKILAKLTEQKINLPTLGYVEVTCENLLNIKYKNTSNLYEAIKLIKNQGNTKVSKRSREESIARWANNIFLNTKRKNGILRLIIQGDYASSEMFDWLKALRKYELTEGLSGLAGSVAFVRSDDEWSKEAKLPEILPKTKKFADFIWARIGDVAVIR